MQAITPSPNHQIAKCVCPKTGGGWRSGWAGYFADSPEGDPTPDMEEIVETRWFTKDEVHNIEDTAYRLPPPDSMARQLMAAWVEGRD